MQPRPHPLLQQPLPPLQHLLPSLLPLKSPLLLRLRNRPRLKLLPLLLPLLLLLLLPLLLLLHPPRSNSSWPQKTALSGAVFLCRRT